MGSMHITKEKLKKLMILAVMVMAALTLSLQMVSAEAVTFDGHEGDCVIPESGPWPPCATGGSTPPASEGDCVIPETGPWPPCATGGGGGGTPPASDSGDCVIPESGPWPPCATGGGSGGGTPPASDSGDCVIPESGPWPPCATGGGGSPAPAPAPAPTPEEPAPAPPAEEEAAEPEVLGYITIVYASNPDEVLGVFPVVLFDAELMYNRMVLNQQALNDMRDSLSGMLAGDQAACDRYESAYERIKENGIFFVDIPGDWINLDLVYFNTFIFALDRTRPAYLSCFDSGRVDQFNHDLAFQTIVQTLDLLNPAVEESAAKLGK